jgi:hypothetical protein
LRIKLLQISKEEQKVKEIVIWYTSTWKEIKAYYRGNPKDSFLLFTANIHWWYEYWTYETAKILKEKLISSNKKAWMIIETLNPDWLQVYLDSDKKDDFYLEWRWNANEIDLNRNFCTKSFTNSSYTRLASTFKTWETCSQEPEIKAIENLLKNYSFSGLIDIHSAWWILFIPENSFDDQNVISFANRVKNLMWEDYLFKVDYSTEREKEELIKLFDIDSWWDWEFTWTLITYFYEQTGFPAVLLELQDHGKIEEEVFNLVEMLE